MGVHKSWLEYKKICHYLYLPKLQRVSPLLCRSWTCWLTSHWRQIYASWLAPPKVASTFKMFKSLSQICKQYMYKCVYLKLISMYFNHILLNLLFGHSWNSNACDWRIFLHVHWVLQGQHESHQYNQEPQESQIYCKI